MVRGWRLARAAYSAAVYPAGPPPLMMRLRTSVIWCVSQSSVRDWNPYRLRRRVVVCCSSFPRPVGSIHLGRSTGGNPVGIVRAAAVFVTVLVATPVPASAGGQELPVCLDQGDFPDLPVIVGTHGPDLLVGTPHAEVIIGLGGDDVIVGGGGDDIVCGGAG